MVPTVGVGQPVAQGGEGEGEADGWPGGVALSASQG